MFSTYLASDVTILLKDITGLVTPLDTATRERRIQSGTHYSEMLPLEYEPSEAYLSTYRKALTAYAGMTARAVAAVAQKIWAVKGGRPVLVSLARAGTPIGILLKRYLYRKYGVMVPHYTISIIRGKGIDGVAMGHILERHDGRDLQFVDGWTGKGAIQRQLREAMLAYPTVSPDLAVLSDPAHLAALSGTKEDFLIPSSCLNATVSGLLSRTFLRPDIIGPFDFHGSLFYGNLLDRDVTYEFIQSVESHFSFADCDCSLPEDESGSGLDEVRDICDFFHVGDLNLVKPGIGESTRVLLRRMPWKILVHSLNDDAYLGHLYQLANEKKIPVDVYPLRNYRACGIIKHLSDT